MKKLIDDPANVVREMLEGSVLLSPDSAVLATDNVVVRTDLPAPDKRRVAVISGGGSGHEPAHAGYVGAGMLTAAVAGDVFTSPSTDAVLAAIRAVSGPRGALLIVKNYTGDRLNFGLAAELAQAEGIPVKMVVVADDVALRDTVPPERRRGIAGTVLVHKIAGAAAQAGLDLAEVARLAQTGADNVASMGISLGACTLPGVGKPGFSLGADEIEIGLGIHGEQGVARQKLAPASQLCALILDTMQRDRALDDGVEMALLVNGLGATPPMELAIVARATLHQLRERKVKLVRAWCGTFLSALDMPGFSLSLLRLEKDLLDWLDAPSAAPAWPGWGRVNPRAVLPRPEANEANEAKITSAPPPSAAGRQLEAAARRAAAALIAAEGQLSELDSLAGDGDLGMSMKRGGEAILALPASAFTTPAAGLAAIGNELRRVIGGSSGPFYAAGLLRAARSLADIAEPTISDWAQAFTAAVEAIAELGGARVGDRTMVDALHPAAARLTQAAEEDHSPQAALAAMAEAAQAGAEASASMSPRLGRASYMGARAIGHPDGGAVAVSIWLKAL